MSDARRLEHNRRRDELADLLRARGTYDSVETEVPIYRRNSHDLATQIDVCATRTVNGITYVHNYEVKVGWPDMMLRNARKQARAFYDAMDWMGVRGKFIYAGRDGYKRL